MEDVKHSLLEARVSTLEAELAKSRAEVDEMKKLLSQVLDKVGLPQPAATTAATTEPYLGPFVDISADVASGAHKLPDGVVTKEHLAYQDLGGTTKEFKVFFDSHSGEYRFYSEDSQWDGDADGRQNFVDIKKYTVFKADGTSQGTDSYRKQTVFDTLAESTHNPQNHEYHSHWTPAHDANVVAAWGAQFKAMVDSAPGVQWKDYPKE